MTRISVYDDDARDLTEVAESYGTTEAEVIMALLDAIREGEIILSEWL